MSKGYGLIVRALCQEYGLPLPKEEYRFASPRRWRFDFCWPVEGVALEVQGGIFNRGRHTRGAALLREHEKLNFAAKHGYRVLYTTPKGLADMGPILKEVLKAVA